MKNFPSRGILPRTGVHSRSLGDLVVTCISLRVSNAETHKGAGHEHDAIDGLDGVLVHTRSHSEAEADAQASADR